MKTTKYINTNRPYPHIFVVINQHSDQNSTCISEPVLPVSLLYHTHYENIPIQIYWKFYRQKNESFQIKNSNIFHISAQNIDCEYSLEPPRRGSSNGYPQSMFLSRHKKNNVYPCKPQFYYIKGGKII